MKIYKVLILAAVIGVSMVAAARADTATGTIIAYDRKAQVIVMDDKSVWSLRGKDTPVPADLKAGDKVQIEAESAGEDGYGKITEIKVLAE